MEILDQLLNPAIDRRPQLQILKLKLEILELQLELQRALDLVAKMEAER